MSDPLDYPFKTPPEPEQALEVAPGIHWLRLPLPFALDHINVWLLEDGDGWTLVDTGVGLDQTREYWEAIAGGALQGRPINRIIVTHYHPDHLGQAAWLSERHDASVHITDGEMALARKLHAMPEADAGSRLADLYRRHGLAAERAQALEHRGNSYRRLVPRIPGQHITLSEGDGIDIGGRRWEVLVGRGHAPEHACLYSESDDRPVLISGDQVLPRISSNVSVRPDAEDEDPLGDFLDSLRRLAGLPAETRVLPSHGSVFEGLQARCSSLIEHHRDHLDRLLSACAEPKTAADMLPLLFRRELDNHQIMFAMGESIAHLRHLETLGELSRVPGEPVRFLRREAA